MFNLSDNYHLRKCFLKRQQVPTQTTMKKIMTPALAEVYFKSMRPKLRVMAGFEPPMKGGGKDWYVPPKDLLEGRAVMKPFKKEYMMKWNVYGVDEIAMKMITKHQNRMKEECALKMKQSDENWQHKVVEISRRTWIQCSAEEALANTRYLQKAFDQFSVMYSTSVNKYQDTIFNAAIAKINSFREETFLKMQTKYEEFLKDQSIMLRDRYDKKLDKEKARLKASFIKNVEQVRTEVSNKVHDINLERHVAVEKIRKFLECQNLACQVYVALKEHHECAAEIELMKHKHKKETKILKEKIAIKDFEIQLAIEKEKRQQDFNRIWQKKVCHVVKRFQMFVLYCLKTMPEYAEYFINMEKLMLLQLSETLENPSVESIIVPDEGFHTPIPKPHPFYLFCEKYDKPEIDQNLCPKHCTSSASQLPVIVVNKRCIYAACDNFAQYTNKITRYLHDNIEYDDEFEDNEKYDDYVPVKYTSEQNLQELKLESPLLQVLEREVANIQEVSYACPGCSIPHCFYCSRTDKESTPIREREKKTFVIEPSVTTMHHHSDDPTISLRETELRHDREPKWEQYMKYVVPKRCDCSKRAKKHLMEHLPAYMRKMSIYDAPELLNYEPCPFVTLQSLVKEASGKRDRPQHHLKRPAKTKDICIQYSDPELEALCTCFSDNDLHEFLNMLATNYKEFEVDRGSKSSTYLTHSNKSFVIKRALSLKQLIKQSSEIKEIFKKEGCEDYD